MQHLRLALPLVFTLILAACGGTGPTPTPPTEPTPPTPPVTPPTDPVTPPEDGAPVINSFMATPSSINAGETATLTWDVTNAEILTISPDVGDVSSETSVTVSPTVTTTYILTAVTADEEYTAATTVTVQ